MRAARSGAEYARGGSLVEIGKGRIDAEKNRVLKIFRGNRKKGLRPIKVIRTLQELMWNNVGVLRNEAELKGAIEGIDRIRIEELPRLTTASKGRVFNRDWIESLELVNMLDLSEMIA